MKLGLSHVPYLVAAVLALQAQTPQPTTQPSPDRPLPAATEGRKATPSGPGALGDAYRRQWDRMSETEQKGILNLGGSTPDAYRNQSDGTTPPPGGQTSRPAPPRGGTPPASTESKGTLDRALTNLDAIRDRYIERASNGSCPPAILSRMADLKWKLSQHGVTIVGLRITQDKRSDFLGMSKDWFAASDDGAAFDIEETSLNDILPGGTGGEARRKPTSDDDVNAMRRELESLASACGSRRQAGGGK